MTWDVAPGGSKILKLGPDEIRTMQTRQFLSGLGGKDEKMFMVTVDLASGVRFWFDDDAGESEDCFPARKGFAWAKTLNRLSCDTQNGLETLCICKQYTGDSNKVKYSWEAEARRGLKGPTGSRGWARTIDAAGNAMARKLLPFLKPEPVRRLEADLAGRDFVSDAEWKNAFCEKDPLQTGCSAV